MSRGLGDVYKRQAMPRYSATISIKVSLILIPFPPIAGSKVVLMDAACILPLFRQRFPNRPILYTRPARLSTLFFFIIY